MILSKINRFNMEKRQDKFELDIFDLSTINDLEDK